MMLHQKSVIQSRSQDSKLFGLITNYKIMSVIDYQAASETLNREFDIIEAELLQDKEQSIDSTLIRHFDMIFLSKTQAYREVLIGCVLVRLQIKKIDIHKPYINLGHDAYNGRTLDEKVVNPFLQERQIPCSKGPFLSAFRRSVGFDSSTRGGLRDKKGFDSLLVLIDYLVSESKDSNLIKFLRYLLYCFLVLRRNAEIPIYQISRMSFVQYDILIKQLLSIPSGGRFPVYLVEAVFNAIKECYNLPWVIECHGINVADSPKGAGGDITIKRNDSILMAAEITERKVDKSRVISTFNTKISIYGIEDYIFFTKPSGVEENALNQTQKYFSQGHEVNFLEIKEWILMILATLGSKGRTVFNRYLVNKLAEPENPPEIKIAWNKTIAKIISV